MPKRDPDGAIIRQCLDGRWATYYVDAERRRKWLFGTTRSEVVAARLAAILRQRLVGRDRGKRLTLGTYLDRWLDVVIRPNLSHATHITYRSVVRSHLKPHLGDVPLDSLTSEHVRRVVADLQAAEMIATATTCRAVLRVALADAERVGLVSHNAAAAVPPPRRAGRR